jgi:HAMP domain-containing protein
MKLQRRQYLIHKRFQFRMMGALLLLVLAATVVTTLVNHFFFLSSIVNFTGEYGRTPNGQELLIASVKPLLIILPIVFIILAVTCLFISHRIAGPLHRLKMYMEKVENGDHSVRLKFRKSDAIHDVAESFNRMVDGIRKNTDDKKKT